ncbi:MAG TPA: urea carboxylase-associated family protein, partial [Thermomicrobiales bacterium]|nr:urea carboxylase-associated family protein [Thermomicrobiales bacterium]
MSLHVVTARKGAGYRLDTGQAIRIVNTHGTQVVDFWAVSLDDPSTYLSMVHTRSTLFTAYPKAGDLLYDNRRAPILRFVEDTSPGIHDTVIAPCDPERYRMLGVEGFHDSCANNFLTATRELNLPFAQ